jgi:ACS family hexuronate transporter-like MFS transporter
MGTDESELAGVGRSDGWRWLVCGLLLLATVVNYMDRLTINTLGPEIRHAFDLNNEQYGQLELGFGLAFAAGGLAVGVLVDWIGVYWLFPLVLLGWSIMGFLTGLSRSFEELLLLRILLGFFEAGHFPCGLKTVQLLLSHRDRAMGNGLLQGGTALGAVLAQPVIRLLASEAPGGWRPPFVVIGAVGCLWILFWFLTVRPGDLRPPLRNPRDASSPEPGPASYWRLVCSAQFLALTVMVVCINMNLHFFRVWLPNFLVDIRGFLPNGKTDFMACFYIAAGLGSFAAGGASSWLANRGLSVYASRMAVYAGCCLLTLGTTVAPFVPPGPIFLIVLMIVAFGTLGTFTAYYSLTQDLSTRHQGKISGSLSALTWLTTATFHPLFGRYLDATKNYDLVMAAMGWLPLVGLIVVLLLWKPTTTRPTLAPLPPEGWPTAPQPSSAIRTSEERITE